MNDELNVPRQVQDLSEKIFDEARTDSMETSMGILTRRGNGEDGYEWVVEL